MRIGRTTLLSDIRLGLGYCLREVADAISQDVRDYGSRLRDVMQETNIRVVVESILSKATDWASEGKIVFWKKASSVWSPHGFSGWNCLTDHPWTLG